MINDFTEASDKEVMMAQMYGEARLVEDSIMDEIREYLGIGYVVMNRVTLPRFPKTIKTVILQPKQFSCFNPGDLNRAEMLRFLREKTPAHLYNRTKILAEAVITGRTRDFSGGADHYVARWFYESCSPSHWCRHMKITECWGGHLFLKEKYL